MKVLFDHQIFSSQKHGGVSKYFAELMRHLPRNSWVTTALLSNNEYARHFDLFPMIQILPNASFRGKGRIISELNKPYSLYKLKKGNFDVFHQTDFDPYCLSAIGSKPMVTTFHDVNFLTIDKNEARVNFQKQSLTRANKIVAISQNTKEDLLNYYHIDESKIEVIHHGISMTRIPSELGARVYNEPYLLFVGLRREFKNFVRFIKAFAILHQEYPDLKVICTRNDFNKTELTLFDDLGLSGKVIYKEADEITMARLYRDAELFVFPSLYEGFGMPILEAMINGCPIALSDTSCFPEIAGDSAEYFDPYEIDDIVNSIKKILDNQSLRQMLIKKGKERVKNFTWEKCAEKHEQLYKSLI